MSDQFGPKRPLGVTIVALLAILSGAFDIIGGIVLLAGQGDAELAEAFGGAGMLVTVAAVSILIGVATRRARLRGHPGASIGPEASLSAARIEWGGQWPMV